jgi:23S rRNA (uracil1939-C5)-methyltransferase
MSLTPQAAPSAPRRPRKGDLVRARVERIDDRGGAYASVVENTADRGGAYASVVENTADRGGVHASVVEGTADRGGVHASVEPTAEPGLALATDARDARERVRLRRGRPGALVEARVLKRRGKALEAEVVRELEPGPHAVAPRCAHAGLCGGCSFQDLAYAQQLLEKRALIVRALEPLAALGFRAQTRVEPVIACAEPYRYRNKMEFTCASRRWVESGEPQGVDASFALGLHLRGRFDKVLDIGSCAIQFEAGDALLASVRELARAHALEPWDLRTHTGLLRHLVLRRAHASGEILVNLVTAREERTRIDAFAAALLARHPEISTLVQTVQERPAATSAGGRALVLHGSGAIRESLGGLDFRVSAASFFQVNTPQAELLVACVREAAQLRGRERVFDLCCGAGVLGLALARAARELVGFELVPEAVEDARRNAAENGIAHARFVCGDLLELLGDAARAAADYGQPDVCVVDPPRAGLHPRVLERLLALEAARVVYVSCNAQAAARELAALLAAGYELQRARPLDLFPHTPHVECVYTLVRTHGAACAPDAQRSAEPQRADAGGAA